MARDAISRQYDVDKNKVTLTCEGDAGSYRPGVITFLPKAGKSLDLRKLEESLRATRLSAGTSMSVDSFEITAAGQLVVEGDTLLFKVSGSTQRFLLKNGGKDGPKDAWQRLRAAAGAGDVTVTGRVEGWKGAFPAVLRALGQRPADAPDAPNVTDFVPSKKQP